MGYATTYIGDERYSGDEDRAKGESFSNRFAIEQTESWWRMWNAYIGYEHSVMSLVGVWEKSELIAKAARHLDMTKVESCFNYTPQVPWCGDCWKCGVVKIHLVKNHLPHNFIPKLSDGLLAKMRKEYEDYKRGDDFMRSTGSLETVVDLLNSNLL
jgi:hypothetical protein